MATLARPGRPLSATVRRAYRLEMAGRTVALLLGLLALTGLVIFYLGVLAGKGLRDPNQTAAADAAAPAPAAQSKPAPAPTALNEALTAPNGQIEGLKKDESTASQQTQQLLAKAKQLEMEELPAKPALVAPGAPAGMTMAQPAPKPAAPATARAAPQKKAAPAAARSSPAKLPAHPVAPASEPGEAYTVQVFSSPQQQSAQDILSDLKKKGFPAYMNQFQAADKRTWYRVRVGKGSKQEAESLATRLRQHSTLQDMRVLKL